MIGITEVIIVGIIVLIYFSVKSGKKPNDIIPKNHLKRGMKLFKDALEPIKEVEYDVRENITEVEEKIKQKKKNDKQDNKDNLETKKV